MKQSVDEFLFEISELGVKLRIENGSLRCHVPKNILTSNLRNQIAERKPEIIEFLQRADFASRSRAELILLIPRHTHLPLSFAQQRLWFLQQLEPDNPFYNEHLAVQLTGTLNVVALEQSVNQIVQRHEVLRTTFKVLDGQPVQIIAPQLTLAIPLVDLSELSEAEQQKEAYRLATEQNQRPFDLVQGPLLRWTLLRLSQDNHVLLFTIHHTVYDTWSLGVIIRELSDLYQAFLTGKSSSLPELPIQYADFAVWQRQELQGENLKSQLAYWKRQLANAPPLLQLPTDHPRPAVPTYRGAGQSFRLSKHLTQALKALSHKAEATLFMTLLAAFKVLLYRYAGQTDIIVGSPIANRTQAEVEGLIGFFVNTLVLRTDLAGNPTFEELLGRVREGTIGAYANQDLPFEKLVEELQPERSINHNPLFQVSFALQNIPQAQRFELPELTLTPFPVESTRAVLDLRLDIVETDVGLEGSWEYNTDLFDAARVRRMKGHFQTLLEAIAVDPQQRIDQLPLLTEAERHQLLREWNQTQTPYPQDVCIHQLFEAQVEKTPDAVAIVFEKQQLTYRELNQQANQLAHYLRQRNVQPETLVGICLERAIAMMIAVLGVLKAGGAYVPLDPAYPPERLAYMLADSQMSVLLTSKKLGQQLPNHQANRVELDSDWELILSQSKENLAVECKPENLAYVIYTSGSTGKPKGVLVAHRGLCNLAKEQIRRFHVQPGSRVLQFASLSFDASIWEIVMALGSGATLCLGTSASFLPGQALMKLLRDQAITHVTLPPTALAVLPAEELPALRTIIVAGEACAPELIAAWSQHRRFFNAYGPTEATVCATVYECTDASQKPPIGRPIANTQIYLLDAAGQLVPIGVPGELHIGSVGLARGYLNRPDLTAERFVPNPFVEVGIRKSEVGIRSSEVGKQEIEDRSQEIGADETKNEEYRAMPFPQGRTKNEERRIKKQHPRTKNKQLITNNEQAILYKTGDLCCYLPNGDIKFLGRIDHQVKIRGFRIELEEIEAALLQHPAIHEVIVFVREDHPGDQRIVAYLVFNQEQVPTINQLQGFVREKLPNYMVPSAFVVLDAIPLTPNGKVDRGALPAPESRPQLAETYVLPQTETERIIAAVWQEILQLEKVGINDNFFNVGGHSLLLVKIQARLNDIFEQELSIVEFFKYPTVRSLAKHLSQQQNEQPYAQKGLARAEARNVRNASLMKKRQFRQQYRSTHKSKGKAK
ncbi:MAG: amino acid adenylation domain-containing protein [Leptolyngbya sp. SIO1E4]|nr:amino acid adenylation domain-containing protein [Leptolyngbya sp. SIO1E4]